jgi:hypothetical protein
LPYRLTGEGVLKSKVMGVTDLIILLLVAGADVLLLAWLRRRRRRILLEERLNRSIAIAVRNLAARPPLRTTTAVVLAR